jgi:hydroxymethylbilane synthase
MSATILDLPQRELKLVGAAGRPPVFEMPLSAGTRGSPLALAQTRAVLALLRQTNPDRVLSTEIIRTTGDTYQCRRLADLGGKGLFSKEIHEALLDRRIDFAVHSLKISKPAPTGCQYS